MLTDATTQIGLEHVMLRERSQTQKATYSAIPRIGQAQARQSQRDRKYIFACPGLGGGEEGKNDGSLVQGIFWGR